MVVENRPGASGNFIAASYVGKTKPDGAVASGGVLGQCRQPVSSTNHLDWDPLKAFTPVALIINSAQAMR